MTETIELKKVTSLVVSSASRLRALWQPVRNVLFFDLADEIIFPAKNVTVSIEKGMVSVAYGSRFLSRIKINGIRLYPLEDKNPSPEGLATSVSLAINSFGAAQTGITLGIPKAWAIIKITELPSTIKENLSEVVAYELDRLTPFSPEEAFYDFKILREDDSRLTLLIVAVKADLITPYVDALNEKGYTVKRIALNLSGIGTMCQYFGKASDILYMRIARHDYEGALSSHGALKAVVTGSFAGGDEKSALEAITGVVERLTNEVKGTDKSPRLFISLQRDCPLSKDAVQSKMPVPLTLITTLDLPGTSSYKEIPYEAIGGVVESLWPKAQGLNLLKKGSQEKAKTPLVLTLVLALVLVALGILYIAAPVSIETKRLQEIERQIQTRKESVRKVESLRKERDTLTGEITTIGNFKGNRPMSLNIVKELTTQLPKTAWLTRVRVTETAVEIEGYASSATELLPKLEASPYFKKAEFASPTFRDVRLNADRFNIKMEIEGSKKEEEAQKEEGAKKEEAAVKKETKKGTKGDKK